MRKCGEKGSYEARWGSRMGLALVQSSTRASAVGTQHGGALEMDGAGGCRSASWSDPTRPVAHAKELDLSPDTWEACHSHVLVLQGTGPSP